MTTLYSILVAVDVLLAIGIIGLILIQHGKGADVGAAFGSGASGTVFGSRGSASFLTRVTAILATLFFVNSLALAYLASNRPVAESVIDSVKQSELTTPGKDVTMQENKPSDVPGDDIPLEHTGSTDQQAEIETKGDAAMNEGQDSTESIKEKVGTTTDKTTSTDVPE